jgi:carboxylate-amine ligase
MTSYANLFRHDRSFTIGVEEEYMLCDPATGDLVSCADSLLANLTEDEIDRFSYELILSEIEINTPVSSSASEVMTHITHYRRRVQELGSELGFRVGISGTQQLHYYAQRNITFAVHVHVALQDAETAIAVTNAARRWLAPLLALSTNSPFFRAHNTGMLSARTFQFGAFPRTNVPDKFEDFEHFQRVLETYIAMDSIKAPRQIWWKIRPHAGYGTVEFRVSDMQRSLRRTEMLVAVSQALCHRIDRDLRNNHLQQTFEMEYLNDALWKATRFGFDAKVADPGDHQIITMADLIEKMVTYVQPSLVELGTNHVVPTIEDVLDHGSEAQEQLAVYATEGFNGLKRMLMDGVDFGDAE